MKAWGKTLDARGDSGIRFLGDLSGAFTKALGVEFESAKVFGQNRSKRYALKMSSSSLTTLVSMVAPRCYFLTGSMLTLTVSAADRVLG